MTQKPLNTDSTHPERDAVYFFFDMTRQFITIAIGAIGFILGIYYAMPVTQSTTLFWITLLTLGLSVVFGLLYFMRGIGMLSDDKTYNVNTPILRIYSISQILFTLLGVLLVCCMLGSPVKAKYFDSNNVVIQSGSNSVNYPITLGNKYRITVTDNEVIFETENSQ